MIIKIMVNEFKLTLSFICVPKHDANLCMHVDSPLDNKTVWASGPPGCQAVVGHGLPAAGPSGLRATGPCRAVRRGPLGRRPAFTKTPSVMILIDLTREST